LLILSCSNGWQLEWACTYVQGLKGQENGPLKIMKIKLMNCYDLSCYPLSKNFFLLPIKVPQGANNLIQWLKWLEAYKDTCKHIKKNIQIQVLVHLIHYSKFPNFPKNDAYFPHDHLITLQLTTIIRS
jgi:hypothetical protein